MSSATSNLNGRSKLTAWLAAAIAATLVVAVALLTSGAWGGSAQASTLDHTQGKGQPQVDGSDGVNPDDVTDPIYEKFLGDNLASSVFHSVVAACVPGGCGWNAVANWWYSSGRSAMAPAVANVSDQQLVLNTGVAIPANAASVTLSFWHYYNFEFTGANYYDGGVLEISTDAGTTWSDSGVQFLSGGYNVVLHAGGNPLAGRSAWGGDSQTYVQAKANLLAYAGQTILIRFREGTDTSNGTVGWSVDDIRLTINSPVACSAPAWNMAMSYPVGVSRVASVAFNGVLYMFGGLDNTASSTALSYKYDPRNNTWSQIAPLPSGRSGAAAVSDGTYIYVLGGNDPAFNGTGTLWRYSPVLNTYTPLAAYSIPTYLHASVLLQGKIYRIGGIANSGTTSTVEVYTISNNTWSFTSNYPQAVESMNVIVDGYYIYGAGGSDNGAGGTQNKTYRYYPATGVWDDAAIADMPQPRQGAFGDWLNGRWVIAGGSGNGNSVVAWNLATNTWSNLPDMLNGESSSGGGTIGQVLYVVGGENGSSRSIYNRRYQEVPCATFTPTPAPPSSTPTRTPTSLPTNTPGTTSTPTTCAVEFSDVPANSTFYSYIECLACQGIISGYADGTFRPGNDVTRGQIAKIVSNSAGYTEAHSTQTFEDVPTSHTFYQFIERLASRGIIGGYACGGAGEQCEAGNKPYFRSNNSASRGQLAKIVCLAFGCSSAPSGQTFEDVPTNHTFYTQIGQLYALGAINGYACGGVGEQCGAGNKPYFRPGANVSRGQTAKIVGNAFFPSCQTP